MAIQNRRGVYSDFTPSKMVPGELAVVQSGDPNNTSGKAVYAAFGASGDVKRLATEDDLGSVDTALGNKVDKVTGKGLSTNDYTTEEKNKLSGIEAQANKTVIDSTLTQTGQAADAKAVGDAIDSVTIETDKTLTEEDVPADAKVVGDELADVRSDLSEKASVIISSASGLIAHFEDGSESDAVDVVAHIEPVQDLHGYDNPWPAGGGKNILKTVGLTQGAPSSTAFSNATNRTFTEGTYVIGLTHNNYCQPTQASDAVVSDNSIKFITGASGYGVGIPIIGLEIGSQYTISADTSIGIVGLSFYQQDGTFISGNNAGATKKSPYTSVVPADTYYTVVQFQTTANDTETTFTNIMLEKSASKTSYAPYSNECPISGFTGMNVVRTGKNLLNLVESEMISSGWNKSFPFAIKAGTYIISCQNQFGVSSTYGARIVLMDANGNTVVALTSNYEFGNSVFSGLTVSITEEQARQITDIKFECRAGGTTYSDITKGNIQLEYGSQTAYEPYTGSTLPVTFPQEAGTVYGGYVDPVKGKLVVDRAMYNPTGSEVSYTQQTGRIAFALPNNLRTSGAKTISCSAFYVQTEGTYCYVTTTMTVEQLKTYFAENTVQMVVYLATPITYDLTPQQIALLLGVNNVWNDTNGDTDVEYKADTKLYIEQLTKPTEDDMTANTAIQSGKFFMIGNRLFISTTTIASGDTINPGTNCTEVSLADALNSL